MAYQNHSMFGIERCHHEKPDENFFSSFMNQNDGFIPNSLSLDPNDPGSGGGPSDPPPPPPLWWWIEIFLDSNKKGKINV